VGEASMGVNLIIKSFRCCGISLDQSGKDDEWLFNYEHLHENNEDGSYSNSENDTLIFIQIMRILNY